jgi:prepilin-type N-terminal cleavage/methylation domain-containing protein
MKISGGVLKQLKSNSGFTLVELLVASAILGILVVASMQFMANQQRSFKTAELKGDLATARNLLASWLESKSICEATLSGMKNNSTQSIAKIISQAADTEVTPQIPERVEYTLGQRIPTTSWAVTNLDLLSRTEAQAVSSSFSGVQEGNGVATVLIKAVLQQVKGTNTLVTATEDRGNFASVTKDLYFPIRVKMAEMLMQTSSTADANPNPTFFAGGMPDCGWNGGLSPSLTIGGTTYTTNSAYLTSLGADSATQFVPDTAGELPAIPDGAGSYWHKAPCWAYSPNLAISECVPAGSSAGF